MIAISVRHFQHALAAAARSIFIIVLLSAILPISSLAAEDSAAEISQSLIRRWDETREAYAKCHLRCKLIHRIPQGQVTKEEARDLVAKLPKSYLQNENDDAIHDLTQIFKLGIDKEKPVWGVVELWLDDKRARQEDWYEGRLTNTLVHTGSEDLFLHAAHRQLGLYPAGGCRRKLYSPSDFAPIPKVTSPAAIQIFGNPEFPMIEAQVRGTTYQVDRSSGFIRNLAENRGRAVREIIAIDGATKSDKTPFPRTTVEFLFHNDLLKKVTIAVFEEIELNTPIPAEKFRLGIEAPTNVFDYRKDRKAPEFAGQFQPTDDILAELAKIKSEKK